MLTKQLLRQQRDFLCVVWRSLTASLLIKSQAGNKVILMIFLCWNRIPDFVRVRAFCDSIFASNQENMTQEGAGEERDAPRLQTSDTRKSKNHWKVCVTRIITHRVCNALSKSWGQETRCTAATLRSLLERLPEKIHEEKDIVASEKRSITIASANQNGSGDNFNCYNNKINCYHNNSVVTVTNKIVTPTILVCCGYINKTFCRGNKVFFSVDPPRINWFREALYFYKS